MSRKIKYKSKQNRLGILGIIVVVVIMCMVLSKGISKSQKEVDELEKRNQELEITLEEEKKRTDVLQERKIYVTTKKYVEEVAKQLGLVYPNEIIYKPND